VKPFTNVEEAIDAADPLAPEWLPVGGRTECNFFSAKVAKLMGAPLAGTANEIAEYFETPAALDHGYASATEQVARQFCDAGGLAFAVWKNPDGHGHITPLTMAPPGKSGTWVANVGAHNHRRWPLLSAFGHRAVKFFTWHPKRASGLTP